MQMTMNVDSENEALAKMIATEMVKELMPVISEMVAAAVDQHMPGRGLTQGELAKRLHISEGTDDFKHLADVVLPSYPAGKNRRWWSKAVDKVMETYEA